MGGVEKYYHSEKTRWEEDTTFHMISWPQEHKTVCFWDRHGVELHEEFFSFTLLANIDLHFSERMTLEEVCH